MIKRIIINYKYTLSKNIDNPLKWALQMLGM